MLSYQDDPYRHAVALWILGAAHWEMFQNYAAYENWDTARKIFQQQLVFFQQSSLKTDQHNNRIRRMEVQLATRPEEIMTWLNYFEDSSLRLLTQPIVRRVREKIRKERCPHIYVLMQDLQDANKSSHDVYERAEIYLEFGLAVYQLGNLYSAIDLLRKAVQSFSPGIGTYHKEVVARCMLGAVERMNEPSHDQAIADWTVSIEDFEKLRTMANRNNDFKKRDWYTNHRRILCAASDERFPST
jgi:tetratricopeptide (TPR) repeat protein